MCVLLNRLRSRSRSRTIFVLPKFTFLSAPNEISICIIQDRKPRGGKGDSSRFFLAFNALLYENAEDLNSEEEGQVERKIIFIFRLGLPCEYSSLPYSTEELFDFHRWKAPILINLHLCHLFLECQRNCHTKLS